MPKAAKPNPENLAPDGLPYHGYVRLDPILAVLPVARSTFLGWVQQGRFPKPIKIGPRASAWRVEDVRAVIAACEVVTEPDPNAVKACAASVTKRQAEAEKAARRAELI